VEEMSEYWTRLLGPLLESLGGLIRGLRPAEEVEGPEEGVKQIRIGSHQTPRVLKAQPGKLHEPGPKTGPGVRGAYARNPFSGTVSVDSIEQMETESDGRPKFVGDRK